MSEIQKIANEITEAQIASKGVSALATRPNRAGQYGQSGLSAADLKAHFDLLATTIATELNKVIGNLATANAGDYIGVNLENADIHTLSALITSFTDGSFASTVCKVAGINDSTITETLDNVLTKLSGSISAIKEQLGMGNEGGGGSGGEGETLPDSAKAAVLQRGAVVGSIQQFDRVEGKLVSSEALARGAIALGEGTKATKANQVVLGKYNSVDNTAIFILGNGGRNDQRNNVLVVKPDQNIYKLYLNDKEIETKEYVDSEVQKVSEALTTYTSAIDSSITSLTEKVTSAKADISALGDRVKTAEYEIDALQVDAKNYIKNVELVQALDTNVNEYKYQIKLTTAAGTQYSSIIDLPTESIVQSGEYIVINNKPYIRLWLKDNNSYVDIPVEKLVQGLVSSTELQDALKDYALSSALAGKADSTTVNSIADRVTEVEDAIKGGVGTIKTISVNNGDQIKPDNEGNVNIEIEIPEVELPSNIVKDVTINGGSVVSDGVANINLATLTRKYVTIVPVPPEDAEYWWDDVFEHKSKTYRAICCTADSELADVLAVYLDKEGDGDVSADDEIFYDKVEYTESTDDGERNCVAYLVGEAGATERGTYILEKNGTVAVGGSGKLYAATMHVTFINKTSNAQDSGYITFYAPSDDVEFENTWGSLASILGNYSCIAWFLSLTQAGHYLVLSVNASWILLESSMNTMRKTYSSSDYDVNIDNLNFVEL